MKRILMPLSLVLILESIWTILTCILFLQLVSSVVTLVLDIHRKSHQQGHAEHIPKLFFRFELLGLFRTAVADMNTWFP